MKAKLLILILSIGCLGLTGCASTCGGDCCGYSCPDYDHDSVCGQYSCTDNTGMDAYNNPCPGYYNCSVDP